MILAIIIACVGFFIFASPVSADSLVINEFMAHPSTGNSEWVEFYNPDHTDIISYWIDDDTDFNSDSGSTAKKSLSSIVTTNPTYPYIEFSSMLNNSGDYAVLFKNDGTIVDQYQYTSDPGSDVTIGRSPDGGSWTTLSSSSKGSSNGGSSPSPTPSPSPSPATTSTFTISNVPSSIDSTQTFTITVSLELSSYPSTKFYLKGAFAKSGSTNYFGLTKVNNSWVKNGSSYSSQYEVSTDQSGKWSGNLEMQPDVMDSGYEGTNDYIFKVGRYTGSGNGPTWSNDVNIKINAKEVQDAEGAINLSRLTAPKASAALGENKSQIDLPEIVYSLEKYKKSTPAARKISTPSAKVKIASQKIPLYFYIIGGVLIFAAGMASVYIHEKIRN